MTWSIPVWLDLWLVGIAGGTYSTAFLLDHFGGRKNRPLLRLATYVGILLVTADVFLLFVDLGNPLRFWHFLTQFKALSPMSVGTWTLLAWVFFSVAMAILWQVENRSGKKANTPLHRLAGSLSVVGLALAVLLMVYGSVLLSVSSKALWSGQVFLPALFTVSDFSMGLAVILIVISVLDIKTTAGEGPAVSQQVIEWLTGPSKLVVRKRMVTRLIVANVITIVIQLAVLGGVVVRATILVKASASEAVTQLAAGSSAVPFWLGVVLMGLLVPLALYIINSRRNIGTENVRRMVVVSSACVICGGLLLRAVIIVAGQLV